MRSSIPQLLPLRVVDLQDWPCGGDPAGTRLPGDSAQDRPREADTQEGTAARRDAGGVGPEAVMPIRTARVQDESRRDYLVRKGTEALALGDRKDALARLRAALEYDTDNDRLRATIAETEMVLGEARQAAANFARVLLRRPADADSWNLLGVLFMEHGERE